MKKITAEIFKAKNGQFGFRLVHKNGNILSSSETYTRKANARKALLGITGAITLGDFEIVDKTKK